MSPHIAPLPAPLSLAPLSDAPLSPARAFAAIEAELTALPEPAVLPLCIDPRYAAQTAMATARRMEALLPELAALPHFDVTPVRRLAIYAAALLYTEMQLEPPRVPTAADPSGALDALDAWLAPRRARAQAYTVLVWAYDQCRRGVTFLRWCNGDVDQLVPPLHPTYVHPEPAALRPDTAVEPEPFVPWEAATAA